MSIEFITILVLSILCIVPNIVVIYTVFINRYHRSDWYLIITNWCLANILQILALLHFLFLNRLYKTNDISVIDIFYCINWMITLIPAMFATLYTFEDLMNTSQFCFYTIVCIWSISIVHIGFVAWAVYSFFSEIILLMTFGLMKILCLVNIIVKFVLYYVLEKNNSLTLSRLVMACICVASNFVFWLFELLSFLTFIPPILLDILLTIVHANGFINLIMLFRYDTYIRSPQALE